MSAYAAADVQIWGYGHRFLSLPHALAILCVRWNRAYTTRPLSFLFESSVTGTGCASVGSEPTPMGRGGIAAACDTFGTRCRVLLAVV